MDVNDAHFEMKIAVILMLLMHFAYSVLKELGLNNDAIRKGFNTYTSNNGRMQYFKRGQKKQ